MAKPEWGTKRTCQHCGAKFYDLGRSPIACPKCGEAFDPEALLKSRRGRTPLSPDNPATAAKKAPKKAVPDAEDGDDENVGEDDDDLDEELDDLDETDEDEDVIEDASELGEDDDVSEVVESVDDDDDT